MYSHRISRKTTSNHTSAPENNSLAPRDFGENTLQQSPPTQTQEELDAAYEQSKQNRQNWPTFSVFPPEQKPDPPHNPLLSIQERYQQQQNSLMKSPENPIQSQTEEKEFEVEEIHTKLTAGATGDPSEQETNKIGTQIVSTSDHTPQVKLREEDIYFGEQKAKINHNFNHRGQQITNVGTGKILLQTKSTGQEIVQMMPKIKTTNLSMQEAQILLSKANKELAFELAQTTVDIAGIADPTPISDGISAAMSLAKGDYLGAGLSILSMIPYLGDAIGKPIKTARNSNKILKLRKEIAELIQIINKIDPQAIKKAQKTKEAVSQEIETVIQKTVKKTDKTETVTTVTRKTAKNATEAAEKLGFRKTNFTSHGQPVFQKGNKYITPDVDSHIGGTWKMADSVKNLASKKTRLGTYDAQLKRIGD